MATCTAPSGLVRRSCSVVGRELDLQTVELTGDIFRQPGEGGTHVFSAVAVQNAGRLGVTTDVVVRVSPLDGGRQLVRELLAEQSLCRPEGCATGKPRNLAHRVVARSDLGVRDVTVLEKARGQTLWWLLENDSLDDRALRTLGLHLGMLLRQLHTVHGMVHGDLHPANVMVDLADRAGGPVISLIDWADSAKQAVVRGLIPEGLVAHLGRPELAGVLLGPAREFTVWDFCRAYDLRMLGYRWGSQAVARGSDLVLRAAVLAYQVGATVADDAPLDVLYRLSRLAVAATGGRPGPADLAGALGSGDFVSLLVGRLEAGLGGWWTRSAGPDGAAEHSFRSQSLERQEVVEFLRHVAWPTRSLAGAAMERSPEARVAAQAADRLPLAGGDVAPVTRELAVRRLGVLGESLLDYQRDPTSIWRRRGDGRPSRSTLGGGGQPTDRAYRRENRYRDALILTSFLESGNLDNSNTKDVVRLRSWLAQRNGCCVPKHPACTRMLAAQEGDRLANLRLMLEEKERDLEALMAHVQAVEAANASSEDESGDDDDPDDGGGGGVVRTITRRVRRRSKKRDGSDDPPDGMP